MKEIRKAQIVQSKLDVKPLRLNDSDKIARQAARIDEMRKALPVILEQVEKESPGTLEIIFKLITNAPILIKSITTIYRFIKSIKGLFMATSTKDRITNVVAAMSSTAVAVYAILLVFGIVVPEGTKEIISVVIENLAFIGISIVGFFTGRKE